MINKNIYHKKIELLAPCGDYESVRAAINAGADSIYMGGKNFEMTIKGEKLTQITVR